jgi:hypothetical protein
MHISNIKFDKYNIQITHDAPSWNSFIKYGVNNAFPLIFIYMNIYQNNILIYEADLIIHGNYFSSGIPNFKCDEFQKNIKINCDDTIKIDVFHKLNNEYFYQFENIFDKSLLDQYVNTILEYLLHI